MCKQTSSRQLQTGLWGSRRKTHEKTIRAPVKTTCCSAVKTELICSFFVWCNQSQLVFHPAPAEKEFFFNGGKDGRRRTWLQDHISLSPVERLFWWRGRRNDRCLGAIRTSCHLAWMVGMPRKAPGKICLNLGSKKVGRKNMKKKESLLIQNRDLFCLGKGPAGVDTSRLYMLAGCTEVITWLDSSA